MRLQHTVKRKIERMTFDKPGIQRHMLVWHESTKEAMAALERGKSGKGKKKKR